MLKPYWLREADMNIEATVALKKISSGGPGSGRRPMMADQRPESPKPGTVCSDCGKTVTNREYSSGVSSCCKADVVPEEDYGKE